MKFRCERDLLVESLTTSGRAASNRGGALPVLSGVRVEVNGDELQLAGSDLDLTMHVRVEVSGDGDGACVLPARLTTDIIRSLEPGVVSISGDDEIQINSGRSQFTIRTLPLAEFPKLPDVEGQDITLPSEDLAEALRQVVRAASNDDARPVLTGVLMAAENEGLRLVATDSYRLAVRDLPESNVLRPGQQVLVPSKALNELQRLLSTAPNVALRLGERDVSFSLGNARIATRLIEGQFPNYRQLIPERYPNRLVVEKELLVEAVRRVKLLVRDNTTPVRMTLRPSGIELTVISQEIGQATEELDAKYEGAEMTVAFNPAYLIDGVEAVRGEEVVLETLDSLKPATLRSTDTDDFLYLLMPVRVS